MGNDRQQRGAMTRAVRRLALAGILAAPLLLAGCIDGAPWPAIPMSRFAPLPKGRAGRVTATTEGAYAATSSDNAVYVPFGTGSLTFALGRRYQLAISAGAGAATIEGDLDLLDGPVRLGLLHGVGGAFQITSPSQGGNGTLYLLRLGLLLDAPAHTPAFAAIGWVYTGGTAFNAPPPPPSMSDHTVYLTLGYPVRTTGLLVTPEITVLRTFVGGTPSADVWGLTGALSIGVPF